MNVIFHDPAFLWLLLLLPVLILLRGRSGRAAAIEFSSVAIARKVSGAARSRAGGVLFTLRLLALAAFVVALARPQLPKNLENVEASGIDIVMVLDLSGSMASVDLSVGDHLVTRVDAAKQVMTDFIAKRPNDRIGLVVFATEPFLVSPITLNHDWLLQNLERIHLGTIDGGSTAIGAGLGMATNRLRDLPSKSRVIILLTDGDNNAGSISPIAAAEAAAAYGVKIYTIGVGAPHPEPVPRTDDQGRILTDAYGRPVYYTDESGQPIMDDGINSDDLQRIAEITHGKFYRAFDVNQLRSIYSDIDNLEKSRAILRHYSTYQELFYWPALLGLGLVGLEQLLSHTRLRRLP
ncbi:MAG: VWA domain-containing protein [Opitutales bacterium]